MRIRQVVGTAAASLGLVMGLAGGVVGAQSATIGTTGPDSINIIKQKVSRKLKVENDNDLDLHTSNRQSAYSGDAKVIHNTTGGDAMSGGASNRNSVEVNASIDNSIGADNGDNRNGGGNWEATIDTTGPDSVNKIVMKDSSYVRVENDNDIHVTNDNCQTAISGDAKVIGNTTGGDAVSGDATNTNSVSYTLNVSN